MDYFKALSLQLDELGIYKTGHTEALLDLSLRTNKELGEPVCSTRLTVAVYIHDIGMAFVPHQIIEKESGQTQEELKIIQNHINVGVQMLVRIPGWEVAAEIVKQHHEKYDGSGYPQGLSGEDINPGAMILALADTFYKVTHKRTDLSFKKVLFTATSMINRETGRLFDPKFMDAFNNTIRNRYLKR